MSTSIAAALALATLTLAPQASGGELGNVAELKILFPDGALSTTELDGGPAETFWKFGNNQYAIVLEHRKARVMDSARLCSVILYEIYNRQYEFPSRSQEYGVAVLDGGKMVWHAESGPVWSSDRPVLSFRRLNRKLPEAIVLAHNFTGDPVTPRSYWHREMAYQFMGSRFAVVLDDSEQTNPERREVKVSFDYGAYGEIGWRKLVKTMREEGGKRSTSLTYREGKYQAAETRLSRDTGTVNPIVLTGPIHCEPPEECMEHDQHSQLPPLLSLDTVGNAVYHAEQWKGPDSFSMYVSGGWVPSERRLLLHFYVRTMDISLPDRKNASPERTNHVEMWLWHPSMKQPVQIGISPGNFRDVEPYAYQWLPRETAVVPGISVSSSRYWGSQYIILARIDVQNLDPPVPLDDETRICLSALNVPQPFARPGSARPEPDMKQACMLASSPAYKWNKPETFNRLVLRDLERSPEGMKDLSPGNPVASGKLVGIDSERAVTLVDEWHQLRKLTLAPNATVGDYDSYGKNLSLDVFEPGDSVTVRVGSISGQSPITSLRRDPAWISGTVLSADPTKRVLAILGDDGKSRDFELTPGFVIGCRDCSISQDHVTDLDFLGPGLRLVVAYYRYHGRLVARSAALKSEAVDGFIAGYDKATGILSIRREEGGEISIRIGGSAGIYSTKGGELGTDALITGLRVRAGYWGYGASRRATVIHVTPDSQH